MSLGKEFAGSVAICAGAWPGRMRQTPVFASPVQSTRNSVPSSTRTSPRLRATGFGAQGPVRGSWPSTVTWPPRVTRATSSASENETSADPSGSTATSSGVCPALRSKCATTWGLDSVSVSSVAPAGPAEAARAPAARAAAIAVAPKRVIIGWSSLVPGRGHSVGVPSPVLTPGDRESGRPWQDARVTADVLARARRGDEEAFRQLVEPYRRELSLHCYRILGSMHDAEDALQDTMLAAWQGLRGFEGRSSVRTWLYRIATSRSLNAVRTRRRRAPVEPAGLPGDLPPPSRLGEVLWLEPCPDDLLAGLADAAPGPDARYEAREAISLAFVTAVQLLPARQRAVLILRDVIGFRAS